MRDQHNGYADGIDMPHNKPLLDAPDFPSVIPENISNQQIYVMLISLHSQLGIVTKAVNQVGREQQVDKQERAEMVETFKTAKGVLKLIYVLGGIGTAILAIVGASRLWS
jgi:hypothetical protein